MQFKTLPGVAVITFSPEEMTREFHTPHPAVMVEVRVGQEPKVIGLQSSKIIVIDSFRYVRVIELTYKAIVERALPLLLP